MFRYLYEIIEYCDSAGSCRSPQLVSDFEKPFETKVIQINMVSTRVVHTYLLLSFFLCRCILKINLSCLFEVKLMIWRFYDSTTFMAVNKIKIVRRATVRRKRERLTNATG